MPLLPEDFHEYQIQDPSQLPHRLLTKQLSGDPKCAYHTLLAKHHRLPLSGHQWK